MPKKNRKQKRLAAPMSPKSFASRKPTLNRRNTLKAFFDRAREVVGLGVKKSEPKMDDTQSANSEYNTATATTPFDRVLTKSAKKRQKIVRSVMRETAGVLFGGIRPDELMRWSQIALDELRREEDRVDAVKKINETIEKTDDWLERQIIRKMLANWGMSGSVLDRSAMPVGELQKELEHYGDEEKRENGQLFRQLGEKICKNQMLESAVKQLLVAEQDRLKEVVKLLTRPMASPTPTDPSPVTPKISQTFACRVTRSTPSPKTLPPVTGGPVPPPLPPMLMTRPGPPAPPLPPSPGLLQMKPGMPPPPPPPSLFGKKPLVSQQQPDPFEKSSRTATIRIGRHDQRPKIMGLLQQKRQDISEEEKQMLDRLFPAVEESSKRPIRAEENRPKMPLQRSIMIGILTEKLDFAQLKTTLRRLEDGSGLVDEVSAMKILDCWPTEEEIKRYGCMNAERMAAVSKPEKFCILVAQADHERIKKRLEMMQKRQSLPVELEGLEKEIVKWEKAISIGMQSEIFPKLANLLLGWMNYLNLGSNLPQLDAMGMDGVEILLAKRGTGEDKTSLGQVAVRHLALERAELEQLRRVLEGDGVKLTPLSDLRRELQRVDALLKGMEMRLNEEATLQRDFGAFAVNIERKIKLINKRYEEMIKSAMEIKEKLKEDDEITEKQFKDELVVMKLIGKLNTIITLCLDSLQKNEEAARAGARTIRSQSLACLIQPMEKDCDSIGTRTTPQRFSLRQFKRDETMEKLAPDMANTISRILQKGEMKQRSHKFE